MPIFIRLYRLKIDVILIGTVKVKNKGIK